MSCFDGGHLYATAGRPPTRSPYGPPVNTLELQGGFVPYNTDMRREDALHEPGLGPRSGYWDEHGHRK